MSAIYLGLSAARGWSVLDAETWHKCLSYPGVWGFKGFSFGKGWSNKSDELCVAVHGYPASFADDLHRQARAYVLDAGLAQIENGLLRVGLPPSNDAQDKRALDAVAHVVDTLYDHCERVMIAGSIRRGKTNPKDGEVVVIPKPSLWAHVDALVSEGVFGKARYGQAQSVRWGDTYRGLDVDGFKVEIFTATPETWGYIYWLRTGPGDANQYMVGQLWNSKMRAADGGIWYARDWKRDGNKWMSATRQQVRVEDERTLFSLFGMEYLDAAERSLEAYQAIVGVKSHRWGDATPYLMARTANFTPAHQTSAQLPLFG